MFLEFMLVYNRKEGFIIYCKLKTSQKYVNQTVIPKIEITVNLAMSVCPSGKTFKQKLVRDF